MKTSFNSIGKAFKKLFSAPKKQTVTPAKSVTEKKKVAEVKESFFQKESTTAYGIKRRRIWQAKAARKRNKVSKRRMLNKISKQSRQYNYKHAA